MQRLKKIFPLFTVLLGSIFVGLSPIFIRLSEMEPISVGFYRLFLSLPILLFWIVLIGRNRNWKLVIPRGRKHVIMLFGGIFFAFDLGLWNLSLKFTTVANSSLFNNFAAFLVPLMVWALYAVRPRLNFVFSLVVALFGSYLIVSDGVALKITFGDVLALLSAVAFGLYIMTMAKLRQQSVSTKELLFWKGVSCSILLAFMAWFMGESLVPPSHHEWILLFAVAFLIQICGQGLLVYSLGKLNPAMAALTLLAAPITSVTTAWILFSEKLTYSKLVGAGLILCSIFLIQLQEKRKEVKNNSKYP